MNHRATKFYEVLPSLSSAELCVLDLVRNFNDLKVHLSWLEKLHETGDFVRRELWSCPGRDLELDRYFLTPSPSIALRLWFDDLPYGDEPANFLDIGSEECLKAITATCPPDAFQALLAIRNADLEIKKGLSA